MASVDKNRFCRCQPAREVAQECQCTRRHTDVTNLQNPNGQKKKNCLSSPAMNRHITTTTTTRSHSPTMWFQQLRGANIQRNAGGGNRTADPSPGSAAISSANAVVPPPTTAQDSSTMRSVDQVTNDQKSVPVDDNGNSENTNGRPDLSTIVEEADEDMCSDLTSGR